LSVPRSPVHEIPLAFPGDMQDQNRSAKLAELLEEFVTCVHHHLEIDFEIVSVQDGVAVTRMPYRDDLVGNPDLAAKPDIAAKIAVAYAINRTGYDSNSPDYFPRLVKAVGNNPSDVLEVKTKYYSYFLDKARGSMKQA
jgi:hypothetical protein